MNFSQLSGLSFMRPYHFDEQTIIFNGDFFEVVEKIPSSIMDALVTDPPFAMAGGVSCGSSSQLDTQFFLHWWRAVATEIARLTKADGEGFIWCDWKTAAIVADGFKPKDQTYSFWRLSQMLFHYREMPGQGKPFRSSVDMIAYARGPKSKGHRIPATTHNFISKYWYYGKHDNHPAEKDPNIAEQLILWCSDEQDVIFDPFMGGGSVAVAAKGLNRKFVGIDREEAYCEVAARRIGQATETLPLLHNSQKERAF